MWTLFYESGTKWFDVLANGSIYLIIVVFIAFLIWLGHDIITGSSLPTGFTPIADNKISSHKADKTGKKLSTSPFSPENRLKNPKLTAKP